MLGKQQPLVVHSFHHQLVPPKTSNLVAQKEWCEFLFSRWLAINWKMIHNEFTHRKWVHPF